MRVEVTLIGSMDITPDHYKDFPDLWNEDGTLIPREAVEFDFEDDPMNFFENYDCKIEYVSVKND